jgi:hypothetical protein
MTVLAADSDALKAQAIARIRTFATTLVSELKGAIKAGGPVNAISVCNQEAPAIAANLSGEDGWQVARTSLKVRNPGNAPDSWEIAVLKRFEARKAAGEDPARLAYAEIVKQDGEKVFRFMSAIPTKKICLKCHGANLAPEVAARLDALYPEDRARGFKIGDIRGAFTLSKSLDQ